MVSYELLIYTASLRRGASTVKPHCQEVVVISSALEAHEMHSPLFWSESDVGGFYVSLLALESHCVSHVKPSCLKASFRITRRCTSTRVSIRVEL